MKLLSAVGEAGSHTHALTHHLKGETVAGAVSWHWAVFPWEKEMWGKSHWSSYLSKAPKCRLFFLLSGILELLHWTLGFPRRLSSACDSVCSQGAAGASLWATLDSIAETKACRLISWHLGGGYLSRVPWQKVPDPTSPSRHFCLWVDECQSAVGMRDVGWEWRMSRSSILPMSLLSLYPHSPSRMLGTWRHCNVLVFFPLTMYLVDSSAFVVWTFFCGSMAVDLKPDVYRLTRRANSKCRDLGSWSQGGPGPFLLTRFPRRFREGQRGEALLCGLLLCGCAVKNQAVSNFWKSRRGLKLGCDIPSRAEVGRVECFLPLCTLPWLEDVIPGQLLQLFAPAFWVTFLRSPACELWVSSRLSFPLSFAHSVFLSCA